MNKKTRKTFQGSLNSIDTNILVLEAVARIREEFDSDCTYLSMIEELCSAKQ